MLASPCASDVLLRHSKKAVLPCQRASLCAVLCSHPHGLRLFVPCCQHKVGLDVEPANRVLC